MCELHQVQQISRRTWLTRSASGLFALWAGLDFGFGRQGWGVLLSGRPRSVAAAQLGDGTNILPVGMELVFGGQTLPLAAYVVVRGDEIAVVDTLTENNAPRIAAVIETAGLTWDNVHNVILTHYHPDHSGSVAAVTDLAPHATVWAGAPDIPQIPLAREIAPAAEGDEIFGLQIIETPGHTDGHISVLDPEGSALLVGDAVFNIGGQLMDILPAFTANPDQARESIRKLGQMTFERAYFGHGQPIEQGASAAFAGLVPAMSN